MLGELLLIATSLSTGAPAAESASRPTLDACVTATVEPTRIKHWDTGATTMSVDAEVDALSSPPRVRLCLAPREYAAAWEVDIGSSILDSFAGADCVDRSVVNLPNGGLLQHWSCACGERCVKGVAALASIAAAWPSGSPAPASLWSSATPAGASVHLLHAPLELSSNGRKACVHAYVPLASDGGVAIVVDAAPCSAAVIPPAASTTRGRYSFEATTIAGTIRFTADDSGIVTLAGADKLAREAHAVQWAARVVELENAWPSSKWPPSMKGSAALERSGDATLIYSMSRWLLAWAVLTDSDAYAAGWDNDFGTREWMGRVALLNPSSSAARGVLRRECLEGACQ